MLTSPHTLWSKINGGSFVVAVVLQLKYTSLSECVKPNSDGQDVDVGMEFFGNGQGRLFGLKIKG